MSKEMISLAETQQWEAVKQKEAERKTLLERFFSQSVTAELAPVVANAIQSLMQMDKQVISLLTTQKSGISQKMDGMRKGRQAHTAYTANL